MNVNGHFRDVLAKKDSLNLATQAGRPRTRIVPLELHTKPISSLAFAPRVSRLASGARDGSVVLWSLKGNGEGGPIGAALMTDRVSAVAWRPDGRALAAVDGRGGVCTWRVS